jgi:hypothetical protein
MELLLLRTGRRMLDVRNTRYESRVSGDEACEGLRQASAWAVSEEDEEDEDGELQLASPPQATRSDSSQIAGYLFTTHCTE